MDVTVREACASTALLLPSLFAIRERCLSLNKTLHSMPRPLRLVLCHPSERHKSTKMMGEKNASFWTHLS